MNLQLSPTDSLLSAPGDHFPSLFPDSTNTSDGLLDPLDMMTPQSYVDDKTSDGLTPIDDREDTIDTTDKKPAKKRKSWGQVLPEPKTNLPPRKRAKTADEKEQRRVERVLRNRRAAQSSRERKRLEVEALEKRNQELETLLLDAQKTNLILVEQLNHFRRDSGVVTRSPCSLDSLCDNQLSLSPELFSSQDGHQPDAKHTDKDLPKELLLDPTSTVDPVAFSPELSPIPEVKTESLTTDQIETHLPDLTQHPAEVLSDLQCHTSEVMAQSFQSSQTMMSPLLAWTIQARMLLLSALTMASVCHRPLTQIALSSKAGFSLLPTPQLLTTIICDFLIDEANNAVADIAAASNPISVGRDFAFAFRESEAQIST